MGAETVKQESAFTMDQSVAIQETLGKEENCSIVSFYDAHGMGLFMD